jgi:diphthamide biosynthesis enzyme Dph1/Dph2-like protein
MKTLFISAKSKAKINKDKIKEISKRLPKNIALAYSIQYHDLALQIKYLLPENNITRIIQVLGCSKPKFPKNTQAILLIGSGRFHAVSLAYETKLPIYILEKNKLDRISKEDIELYEKKNKASYLKYLNSDNIGILISTKPGQQNLKRALDFKKKSKKNSYLFISNDINTGEFENFTLDCWVNTACPRLDMDSSIININKIKT